MNVRYWLRERLTILRLLWATLRGDYDTIHDILWNGGRVTDAKRRSKP